LDDPFHAYVARPISGKTPEETRKLAADAERVRQILAKCSITSYDPGMDRKATAQQLLPDGLAYQYSREQLAKADFAVFLLSAASWGVGAQNELATSLVMPVIYLHPSSVPSPSQMLMSSFNMHWIITYDDLDQLESLLTRLLNGVEMAICWNREVRRAVAAARDTMAFARRVRELRRRRSMSFEQLALVLGVSPLYIQALEQFDDTVVSPSLELLHRLAALLGVPTSALLNDADD